MRLAQLLVRHTLPVNVTLTPHEPGAFHNKVYSSIDTGYTDNPHAKTSSSEGPGSQLEYLNVMRRAKEAMGLNFGRGTQGIGGYQGDKQTVKIPRPSWRALAQALRDSLSLTAACSRTDDGLRHTAVF